MKISILEKGKMKMYWNEILVLTLLAELIGPELAKAKYKLTTLKKHDENIYHFYGKIEKIGKKLIVHSDDGEESTEIHMVYEMQVERRLNSSKKVHVFAKKRGRFDAVLLVSDNLYGLVSSTERVEEKLVLLQEYLRLRADHQRIVYEFLMDSTFRKSMILFSGFVASNKLEKYYGFCEDIEILVEKFNSTFARKLNISPVDYLYAETLLYDMIGDILFLNPNAVTPFYSWPHLLATNSLNKGCSIWQLEYDTVGEVLLNKSENQPFIPICFLTALLSNKQVETLVQELIRLGKGKKKERAGWYLVHIVRNIPGLSDNSLKKIEKFLFEKGTPEYILPDLHYLKENTNVWEHFLKYITRMHGEEYGSLLSEMITKE